MEFPSQSDIRLLIIAGEEAERTTLLQYFQTPRYQTTTVGDADTALRYLSQPPEYDVALLDLCMPDKNGFDLLKAAQRHTMDTFFVLITQRDCLEDKLHGFQLGADDYVVKPCAMEELEARVNAVLRRRERSTPAADPSTFTRDGLTINFAANTCFREDRRIPLTSLEFDILEYLVAHKGQVVPREELRDAIWADREGICLRTIDRHVAKIREKLEQDPNVPAYLQTVYGKGYKFACAEYA